MKSSRLYLSVFLVIVIGIAGILIIPKWDKYVCYQGVQEMEVGQAVELAVSGHSISVLAYSSGDQTVVGYDFIDNWSPGEKYGLANYSISPWIWARWMTVGLFSILVGMLGCLLLLREE